MRVFGEDLTVAGREAAQKQKQKQTAVASTHNPQSETPPIAVDSQEE
jgi:hypothetical protein